MNATKFSAALLCLAVMLPMLAQAQSSMDSLIPISPGKMAKTHKALDLACVASAIDTRDTAIESGVDVYASGVKTALETRKNSLRTAWIALSKRDTRRQDIQKAWRAYSAATKSARQDFRKARMAAWEQFRKDRDACGSGGASMDRTGAGADNTL